MKTSLFRTVTALLFPVILSTGTSLSADIQKTFTWNYRVNGDATVKMENYDCKLEIHTWDKGEAELRLSIEADIRSDEDAAALDTYLRSYVFGNSPSSVSFRSKFWDSRTTIMNRTTMKLEGGNTITLNSFTMRGELWIPSGCRFELSSKYSQISMDDLAGSLYMDLYNDNLYGGTVQDAEITDKYSTIELKDMKDVKADLYNTKFNAGNTGDLVCVSKYSKVYLASCRKLSADSYNDKFEIPVTGDVTFTGKYSDLTTETSGSVTIDSYNGTIIMGTVRDLKATSKYTEYQFTSAARCSFSSSYNDKFTAGRITSMVINESKYFVFRTGYMEESLEDRDSYNDKFTISDTGKGFRGLKLNGKYIVADITLEKSASFRLKADIKYAELDLDESALKPIVKVINGSEVKYDAVRGVSSDGIPVIELSGYDIKLEISDK